MQVDGWSFAAPPKQTVPPAVREFREALKTSPQASTPFSIPPATIERPISPVSVISSEGHVASVNLAHRRSRSASQSTTASITRRHSRRGSIASFMGFGGESIQALSAIPPALSEARISVVHHGADQKAVDTNLMDDDLPTWPRDTRIQVSSVKGIQAPCDCPDQTCHFNFLLSPVHLSTPGLL
jgi:hypothetical protein